MVQRFSGMGSTWTMPRENGDYVRYEDYAALEQHYSECHAAWLDAYEVNKDLQRRIAELERDLEHIQRGERGSW